MFFNRRHADRSRWLQAASLGAVAGLRSMMAPAMVSRRLSACPPRTGNLATRTLARPWVAQGLGLAAAFEVAADKLPFIAARTAPLPLLARALWGAVAAVAWVGQRRPPAMVAAALLGATTAVGASHFGYHLRARVTRGRGRVAGALAGLAEDLLAAGLARAAGPAVGRASFFRN